MVSNAKRCTSCANDQNVASDAGLFGRLRGRTRHVVAAFLALSLVPGTIHGAVLAIFTLPELLGPPTYPPMYDVEYVIDVVGLSVLLVATAVILYRLVKSASEAAYDAAVPIDLGAYGFTFNVLEATRPESISMLLPQFTSPGFNLIGIPLLYISSRFMVSPVVHVYGGLLTLAAGGLLLAGRGR